MLGNMMGRPLMVSALIEHAARYFRDQEVVTHTVEGTVHRYSYAEAHTRMKRLANALEALEVERGERVATLAWNTYRHLELYYGIAGYGAVCHTINPRLFRDQLVYIFNHAEDRIVFLDTTFVPLLEQIQDELPGVETFVVLCEQAAMPVTSLRNATCYETLIEAHAERFDWPELDENSASMLCYTSGTTGNPKGSLYSHRSTVLHALFAHASLDRYATTARDSYLAIVPMFHVCAWGIPFMVPMVGSKLVFPGPHYGGDSLFELMDAEGVTMTAGVPTIVTALVEHMRERGRAPAGLSRVLCGGSAPSEALVRAFEQEFDIPFVQGWGMTETSPIGAVNIAHRAEEELPEREHFALKVKQGRPCLGFEVKIVDDGGERMPEDGRAVGELAVRSPFVIDRYFEDTAASAEAFDAEGWLLTGDVASIDVAGFVHITDRSKDLIKSGGEWISSIDLENAVMGHPAVAEAAAIGCHHPKWEERPLLVIVARAGQAPSKEELLAFLDGKVAKWWLPDDVAFVDSLPHGPTGKVSKRELRAQFAGYELPSGA